MAGEASPLKVFVSYSRADVAFADQLVLALEDKGFEAILDRHDISGAENWRERLGKLILSGDAVTFVLTEKSATSEICKWEVAEAKALGKRIIPITPGPLGNVTPPQELAELNWIPFYADPAIPGSGFYYGVVRLNEALSVDLEWLRAQTRYSERALEWAKEKAEDLLLRGEALREAEAWLARMPAGAHPPDRVREYLAASGDVEQHRQAAAKAQLQEREQALKTAEAAVADSRAAQHKLRRFSLWALVAGVVLLAIAIPGNYFAATRTLDANDRRAALFADASNDLSRQGDYNRALLMALAGDPPARAGLLESLMRPNGNLAVRNALVRAYANDGAFATFATKKDARGLAVVGDGERFVTIFEDGTAELWRAGADLKPEALPFPYMVENVFAVGDGDTLILLPVYSGNDLPCAWSISTQKVVRCFGREIHAEKMGLSSAVVDDSGRWLVAVAADGLVAWNIADGTQVGVLTSGLWGVDALVANADEGYVVTTYKDDVLVWRLESNNVVGPVASGLGEVGAMVSSKSIGVIFGTDMGQVGSIDLDTGKTSAAFQTFGEELTQQEGVSSMSISGDQRLLLFTSTGGQFRVIDILGSSQEEPFGRRSDVVDGVYLSKAGMVAALTRSGDVMLAVFEQKPERKLFADVMGFEPAMMAESLTGDLVLRTARGQIAADFGRFNTRVWDPATRETITFPTMPANGQEPGNSVLSLSEDSSTLLRATDGVIQIWKKGETAAASTVDLFKEGQSLQSFELLPAGDGVLYTFIKGDERFAAVRRFDSGQDIDEPRRVFSDKPIVSRDGQMIADGGMRSVEIYRAGQVEPISIQTQDEVTAIAFSPDGAMIAVAQSDGKTSLWRIGDARPSLSVSRHKTEYNGDVRIAFHPNGELFATANEDGRVTLWRTNERDAVQEFRLPLGDMHGLAIDRTGTFVSALVGDEQLLYPIDPIILADVDTQVKMACKRLESRGASGFRDQDYDEYSFIGKFDSVRDRNPCFKLGVGKAPAAPAAKPAATPAPKVSAPKVTDGN